MPVKPQPLARTPGMLLFGAILALLSCDSSRTPTGPVGPEGPPDADEDVYQLPTTGDLGLSPVQVQISVELPASAGIDPADLRLLSALQQTAPLGASGSVGFTVFEEGPMLVAAVLPTGEPVLMGWVDATTETHRLSPRSTAEVFAWFDTGSQLLLDPLRPLMAEALRSAPELAPLEQAVSEVLSSAPYHLEGAAAALSPVRDQAAQAILGSRGSGNSGQGAPSLGIVMDPGDAVSGARVLQQGLDRIAVENNYRIRRIAYVDRVDPSPAEVAKIDLSPTTGVNSLTSAVSNIVTSAIFDYDQAAYAGKTSDPVRVPMTPEDGDRTEYRVTVIGAGSSAGSAAQLSSQRTDELRRLIRETLILDFLMPVLNNIALPMVPEGTEMPFGENLGTISSLVEQLLNRMPGVIDRAYQGDMLGAARMFLAGLLEDNAKDLILSFLDGVIEGYLEDQVSEAAREAARKQFKEGTEKILRPLALGDAILQGLDLSVQVAHIGSSSRAEVFDVTVTPGIVNLMPPSASVNMTEELELTAVLPEAAGGDDAFEYRWWTSGTHGVLRDAVGHEGTEFSSSRDRVVYVPEGSSTGEDVVIVEVYMIDNQDRIRVGSDTAAVRVTDIVVTIGPEVAAVRPGDMVRFTAEVDPMPEGTVYYRWTTSGNQGTTLPVSGALGFDWLEYTARDDAADGAEDWIEVEIFVDLTDQNPTGPPLAKARATVEIDEQVIIGSIETRTGTVGDRWCVASLAKFPLVEGATGYDMRVTNHNHTFYPEVRRIAINPPFAEHPTAPCPGWSYGVGGVEGDTYVYRLATSGGNTDAFAIAVGQLQRLYGGARVEVRPRF